MLIQNNDIFLRDRRIDFARGVALICIFIDHIPNNPFARFTIQNYGFSDASELFVLLAGLSAALAYGSKPPGFNKSALLNALLVRARSIYLAHLALVAIIALGALTISSIAPDSGIEGNPLLRCFQDSPWTTTLQVVTLTLQPEYLDILPLYVLFFAIVLPIFLYLRRWGLLIPMALSFALWLAVMVFQWNLPSQRIDGWFFNPIAWQLCFSTGVYLGLVRNRRIHDQPNKIYLLFGVAFLVVGFIFAAPWTMLPIPALKTFRLVDAVNVQSISKTNLSGLRLMHVICLVYVAGRVVPRDIEWIRRLPLFWIVQLGQRSLPAFIMTVLLSHSATALAAYFGNGRLQIVMVSVLGISILCAYARHGAWSAIEVVIRFFASKKIMENTSLQITSHATVAARSYAPAAVRRIFAS